ncbi:MAG: N-acetyltransferase [Candidatus Thorarchaeota archaeon]|nr:N-acetyltransferase [Candidatus Thorarchaeota archaeon]
MLDFVVGYDFEEFKKYYKSLGDLHKFYIKRTSRGPREFKLGDDERFHVENDIRHLIIWIDSGEIVGHCIWHETSTDEMTPGDPVDDDYKDTLRGLYGGQKGNLVELHELWLRTKHRGKGYGHQFFDFFEDFVAERGFDGIIHYSDHPAVLELCRKRGYKEAFLESSGWYVFTLEILSYQTK